MTYKAMDAFSPKPKSTEEEEEEEIKFSSRQIFFDAYDITPPPPMLTKIDRRAQQYSETGSHKY